MSRRRSSRCWSRTTHSSPRMCPSSSRWSSWCCRNSMRCRRRKRPHRSRANRRSWSCCRTRRPSRRDKPGIPSSPNEVERRYWLYPCSHHPSRAVARIDEIRRAKWVCSNNPAAIDRSARDAGEGASTRRARDLVLERKSSRSHMAPGAPGWWTARLRRSRLRAAVAQATLRRCRRSFGEPRHDRTLRGSHSESNGDHAQHRCVDQRQASGSDRGQHRGQHRRRTVAEEASCFSIRPRDQ